MLRQHSEEKSEQLLSRSDVESNPSMLGLLTHLNSIYKTIKLVMGTPASTLVLISDQQQWLVFLNQLIEAINQIYIFNKNNKRLSPCTQSQEILSYSSTITQAITEVTSLSDEEKDNENESREERLKKTIRLHQDNLATKLTKEYLATSSSLQDDNDDILSYLKKPKTITPEKRHIRNIKRRERRKKCRINENAAAAPDDIKATIPTPPQSYLPPAVAAQKTEEKSVEATPLEPSFVVTVQENKDSSRPAKLKELMEKVNRLDKTSKLKLDIIHSVETTCRREKLLGKVSLSLKKYLYTMLNQIVYLESIEYQKVTAAVDAINEGSIDKLKTALQITRDRIDFSCTFFGKRIFRTTGEELLDNLIAWDAASKASKKSNGHR